MLTPLKENYDQPRQGILQSREITNKGPSSQSYGFSSSHVWMWHLDYKESWALKNWHSWTVVLEKTLENPSDWKEIQPVHPTGDQSWVFIGRSDVEAETSILWPPDVKSWLIWSDPDSGKDWGQEEKGMTENEMAGWHHQFNGHVFGWTPGAAWKLSITSYSDYWPLVIYLHPRHISIYCSTANLGFYSSLLPELKTLILQHLYSLLCFTQTVQWLFPLPGI